MINIEDALSYFHNERLFGDDFINAEQNRQNQAIKMATNQIGRLKFSMYVDDLKENSVKKAVCEQALYLIQTANSQRQRLIDQGVTSFSVEGLSESYDSKKVKNKVCSEAMEYLKPYLLGCVVIC
ncbi:hypothetical protein [Terrisporobacter vanillatitrophus]|uniref:hypothetical protein n=1 Tax=Terrisporobacter vanillatitrophus TaxID=3058402 RepID=UPI003366C46F